MMLFNLASLSKALEKHTSKSPQGCERSSRYMLGATVASYSVFTVALCALARMHVKISHQAVNDVWHVRRTLLDALTVNRIRFCSSICSLVAVLRALRESAPKDMVCFAGSFPLYMYLAWVRGRYVNWTRLPNDIDIFVTSVDAFKRVTAHIATTFPLAHCRETDKGSNYFPSSVRRRARISNSGGTDGRGSASKADLANTDCADDARVARRPRRAQPLPPPTQLLMQPPMHPPTQLRHVTATDAPASSCATRRRDMTEMKHSSKC